MRGCEAASYLIARRDTKKQVTSIRASTLELSKNKVEGEYNKLRDINRNRDMAN